MNDQDKRNQLMYSDRNAKKLVGKMWWIILPVAKFFSNDF